MCDETTNMLVAAVEGLMYPSERDTPFDLQLWPATLARSPRDLAKKLAHGRRVQPIREKEFFVSLSKTDDAARFAKLECVFAEQLTDRAIFRIGSGETSVDLYLIGLERSGRWVGLHTISIET